MNFQTFKTNKPVLQALERAGESLAITAFISACTAIIPLLSDGTINWRIVGLVFAIATAFSVGHGIIAYIKPYNAPLAEVLDTIVSILERKYAKQQQSSLQGGQPGPLVVIHQNTPTTNAVQPARVGQTDMQSGVQMLPDEHPNDAQMTMPLPAIPKS